MTTRLTYAIGDLHGRFDLLKKAVNAAVAHAEGRKARFILLGDMVDRGFNSRQILDFVLDPPEHPNFTVLAIKGNHEDMMLQILEKRGPLSWWVRNGGGQTLKSYGYKSGDQLFPLKVPQAHIKLLRTLPVYIEDKHRVYVHAGVPDYYLPLAAQSSQTLMWMLYDKEDRGGHKGRHVVHGHHQHAEGPLYFTERTNIDTFAWLHGRAAVAVFDDDKAGGPVDVLWVTGPTFEQLQMYDLIQGDIVKKEISDGEGNKS